jgi:glycosyltransferase involved in cell wall biosynthesis
MLGNGKSHRAVVLGGGALGVPGGLSMRWRALRDALNRLMPCRFREIGCDRWEGCQRNCQMSGGPARTNNVTMAGHKVWFHDRNYCEEYVRSLADDLSEAGVTLVVCSGLDTYRYVTALASLGRFKVVFDMHNIEAVLHKEIYDAIPPGSPYATHYTDGHARLVDGAERSAVLAADSVWVCSDEDRELVSRHFGVSVSKVEVVPNVVEVLGEGPPPNACERVSYTGRIDWYPNIGAGQMLANEIAPLLLERGIELPVVIAGKLAQELLGHSALGANVRLISSPAQTANLITGSIMAVPLTLGGGSRFKVLEAFANGAPVVSTLKGVEGLRLVPHEDFLVAEKPAEFADAIEALVTSPQLRARLAGAGWETARQRFSIDALTVLLGSVTRLR